MAQVKSKEDYLIEHSKQLEELRNKADSIELEDGKFLDSPEEYAEESVEAEIIKYLPLFIEARKLGKKLARRLID
jgi:hypothetical protein